MFFKLLERFLVKWRNLTARLERKLYTNFSAIPLEDPLVYLGFDEPDTPEDEHRFGGFGVGGFGSVHQNHFLEKTLRQIKSSKRGIYYGNEADRLIGSRGFQNTYILTEDGSKSGPLKEASNIIPISHKKLMTVQEFRDHLDTYTST